jgi:hypothetical protein
MTEAHRTEDGRLGGGDVGCALHEVTNCDMCSPKKPTIEYLQDLLREARQWVLGCYPTHQQEAEDREFMIQRIDAAAPPPPDPVFVACEKESSCCLSKNHRGPCNDIPF